MLRLVPVFIATFFLSLNFGTLLYVKSTFLGQFFTETRVSIIFLAAAAINILLFLLAPGILNRLGKEKTFFSFLLLTFLGTILLTDASTGIVAVVAFILYESFLFLTYWALDIFVEKDSLDSFTGNIRGVYFTFINAGILLGPIFVALLSPGEDLTRVFSSAAILLMLPLLFSVWWLLRERKFKHIRHPGHFLPFRRWWHSRNIRAVTLSKLVLEIFYALMVIYTPIYLHNRLGFEWAQLGIVFAIVLLPFVFLEWPAGFMADNFWGEKEMMGAGFFLMGIMLLIMPFLDGALWLWTLILFTSRIGAATVEITTESYFFKKIDADDTGYLSIFRIARPAGLLIGASIGALTIALLPFSAIFIVVALVVFLGLYESLHLKDTL